MKQLVNGWYVNSAPIITAVWTANVEDQWIVPLGGGGGKLVMLGGKLPLIQQTQLYDNVVQLSLSRNGKGGCKPNSFFLGASL